MFKELNLLRLYSISKGMAKQKIIAFKAPPELIAKFDELCDQLHINKSDIAREWLERSIPELEDMVRAQTAIRKARSERKVVNLSFPGRFVALHNGNYCHAYEPSYA
jgi:predicted DNA-binding protein